MRLNLWKKVTNTEQPNMLANMIRVKNAITSTVRQMAALAKFGITHNEARDLNQVFGWTAPEDRNFDFYLKLYRYQGLPRRVVNILPRSCWRSGADFRKNKESKEVLLEKEMKTLKKAGMFTIIERADILNRIGSFSVLYVGVPELDETDLTEPIASSAGPKDLDKVFFASYSEKAVTINSYDQNKTSSRYGKPLIYTLMPGQTEIGSKVAETRQPLQVHWSRVVHMAEGSLDDGISGISELEDVANRMTDLQKILGGSAESFYRNAHPKFTMDIDKDISASETEIEAFDGKAQEFMHDWKSFIGLSGAKIRQIMSRMIDPSASVKVQLQMISGAKGISIRILTGEGAGQLAGSEDRVSYNQLNGDRQNQICEPWLLRIFEILEQGGLVKMPDEFVVTWPLSEALDEKTKSEVTLNEARAAEALSRAIQAYSAAPGIENVIPPNAFLALVIRMDTDEIDQISKELSKFGSLGDGTPDPE